MPISIYRVPVDSGLSPDFASLCDNEWLLAPQIEALNKWIQENHASIPPDGCVAEIRFGWRRSASASGPVLAPATMKRMAELGISLLLAECPGFVAEREEENWLYNGLEALAELAGELIPSAVTPSPAPSPHPAVAPATRKNRKRRHLSAPSKRRKRLNP